LILVKVIPQYPGSRSIDLNDKELFDAAFKKFPPQISEYTFTNLYAWRQPHGISVSQYRGYTLVSSRQNGKNVFYPPIGPDPAKIIKEILLQDDVEFFNVTKEIADKISGEEQFLTESDRDNWDYLYKIKDLIELKGGNYSSKRNFIRRFKSEQEFEYLALPSERLSGACREFENIWCEAKNCDIDPGLNAERQAFYEMIERLLNFNLICGAIRVNDRVCAAAIAERLNKDTMVMHILKALPDITGLYQVMLNEFLSRNSKGFEYLNMEEDLGVEGLRKSKESYKPFKMVEKYRVKRQP
jgi:hypothetical protein